MIAILTAVYDHFDSLYELPPQDEPVDAVCVTDNPNLQSGTWRVVYEPRPNMHPCLAAKWPKLLPWRYTTAESSVWIDASFRVTSETFATDVTRQASPICQFVHPDRDCIYDESAVSVGMAKYATQPIDEQVKRYADQGHPEHWGLWCTGVIGRFHTREVKAFCEAWLHEIGAWSFQDQLSQAPLLRECGLRPIELPGCYWPGMNPWLRWEGSSRH